MRSGVRISLENETEEGDTVYSEGLSPKMPDFGVVRSPRRSLRLVLSPGFGPKTKACIVPSKDLSSAPQLEIDSLPNYYIWSDIGKGSYATVKLATHKQTSQKFAIKIYRKKDLEDPGLRKNVNRELKILKKLSNPNIVQFHEEIWGTHNLYIVMEYVKGTALNIHVTSKSLKRLDETEACELFSQIVKAVEYCHSKNIVHRDIKLENVLLDLCFKVKLIDFGFATCFSNNKKALIFCGSPTYMAPEIITKQEFFGPPVDIWALGVVLYVLVTGRFPFNSKSEKRVFEKVTKGKFDLPEFLSGSCQDLLTRILTQNPDSRPTAKQILSHVWIKSGGGSAIYALPSLGDNIEVSDIEL